jgi:hypothetical protein
MMAQARLAITEIVWIESIQFDRAPRLIERIKIETRWILLTAAHEIAAPDAARTESFIAHWRAIRNARLPADEIARRFYDIAAEQAATFAALIIARRNKKVGL